MNFDPMRGNPDEGPTTAAIPADGDGEAPMTGRRIGPYQLEARVGGGMGTVYRARRVEDFRQEVVVKLLHHRMDGSAIARRFQAEAHVHAVLGKHADIAGLLDAGTTEAGRLYFVMEHVDGQRIDEYCDLHRLDIAARLGLFARACDVVHFVHQHAVIHRDLKPSNVLVAAGGAPKLVDLGIAGLIDPGPGGAFEPIAALAPDHASPEQVQGEPITTASDVYALGVVLYQLLAGRLPYRLEEGTASEVLRAICEQVPERPSTAVFRPPAPRRPPSEPRPAPPSPSPLPLPAAVAEARGVAPGRLRRALRGDLDAIVLMALRKEPARRYASAEQLADDVRRHLAGVPVRARGDSPGYRAARFARRHPAAVAAGLVLLLALVAGVAGTTWGLVGARRQRDRAEASASQARAAINQLFDRVRDDDDRLFSQPGLQPLRQPLLQDARRFYERFLEQPAGGPALRAERAAASSRLAWITGELGAEAEAVSRFQRAVALWEAAIAANAHDPGHEHEHEHKLEQGLARTLNDLGELLMRLDGRRDEALAVFGRARDLLGPSIAADPRPGPRHKELGRSLQNMASIQHAQGRPDEAIADLERSLAIESRRAAERPGDIGPRIAMARAHALLGQVLVGRPDGPGPALEACGKAVELLQAVTRERPELAEPAYLLAIDLADWSVVQQIADKLDSALKGLREAVAILERLDRRYPGVLNYQGGLASTWNMISDLHGRRGEPAESLAAARKARDLLERLVEEHPDDVDSHVDLGKAYNRIGRGLLQEGDRAEALRSFQRAVDSYESLPHLDPRNSYILAGNLALCIPLIAPRPGPSAAIDLVAASKEVQSRRRTYGDRAVGLLRLAARGGFVSPEALLSDTDLDPLRERADFQELVQELERKPAEGPE